MPAPRRVNTTGFDLSQNPSIFLLHRHTGNMDGSQLYGPYFIIDSVTGKKYKIVCKNGTLSAEAI